MKYKIETITQNPIFPSEIYASGQAYEKDNVNTTLPSGEQQKANKPSLVLIFAMLCLQVLFSTDARSQQTKMAQQYLNDAIKKAYPACVRMWGFDTEKNERTSAQFSGVVVTADGIVLTAAHTVQPGNTYKVFFPDGKEVTARALGRIDLAASPGIPDVGMLKIMGQEVYPFAEMGYVHEKIANHACISISYPERLNQALPTLRYGKVAEVKNEYGFLRSTCKMEPGDSGGALFDQRGRVIGLHSAIDVNEDMNFEIPINLYRKYWAALQEQISYTEFPTKENQFDLSKISAVDYKIEQSVDKLSKNLMKKAGNAFKITSNHDGQEVSAVGTLFNYMSKSGVNKQYILSKSTQVNDQPYLWIKESKTPLVIIKRDVQNDLILLKAPQMLEGGIAVVNERQGADMGTFIAAILPEGAYQRGIVGNDSITLEKNSSLPYFGASVLFKSSPVTVTVVKPGSPAALAGIQSGDVIVSINQIALKQANEFAPMLAKYWPGDKITITFSRNNQTFSKDIALMNKPFVASNHPVDKFVGGVSDRRDGFSKVFVHDATLMPNQYGGPIYNLNGQFLGVNIARYSRAISLGIPQTVIYDFIKSCAEEP